MREVGIIAAILLVSHARHRVIAARECRMCAHRLRKRCLLCGLLLLLLLLLLGIWGRVLELQKQKSYSAEREKNERCLRK